MIIKGLQKLTLIDYPGKLACTIFLFGCNFRCSYCHNPELINGNSLIKYKEEDILKFLETRKDYLNGICITGGEPLLTLDVNFLKKVKALGYNIKIDTNGSFPGKLKQIIDEKLVDYIAMDIKASKENYKTITNSDIELKKIEESIKLISNFDNYEFRTTIVEKYHDKEEMKKMISWLESITDKKLLRYYLQGFKNNGKTLDPNFNEKDIEESYLSSLIEVAIPKFENIKLRI